MRTTTGRTRRGRTSAGALAVLMALTACITINTGEDGERATEPTTQAAATPGETTAAVETATADETETSPPTASGLAASVVHIVGVDSLRQPLCSGSGSVIDPTGLILTNAHVVTPSEDCPTEILEISVSSSPDLPPERAYVADVVAIDEALDLAVLQITSDLDGAPVDVDLPALTVGDSDTVELGQDLRILGYPGIGGDTITFTAGAVSGFTADASAGNRAWIKTDATIAGGNSGGSAVDADGRLVAVPTKASGREDGDVTDCRRIQDTNGDGQVDGTDSCIPIGGFINGLRPVNLALALIEEGRAGVVVEPDAPEVVPVSASLSAIRFAPGVTDGQPTEVAVQLPSGSTEVCGFWDYQGMADGVTWDAIWLVDGEPQEDKSLVGQEWSGGESGTWWVCAQDASGLPDGPYELQLFVDGDLASAASVHLGDGYTPLELTVTNATGAQICLLYLSPATAQQWGTDQLGDTILDAGETVAVPVVDVPYDLRAWDCSPAVVDERFGVEVGNSSLVLGQG